MSSGHARSGLDFVCAMIASAALASCSHPHREQPRRQEISASVTRAQLTRRSAFNHAQPDHAHVTCNGCHARDPLNPSVVEPLRPYHDSCIGCHSTENYLDSTPSEQLCAVCHPARQALDASLATSVLAFPKRAKQFGLTSFSHRTHMSLAKRGVRPDSSACIVCHRETVGAADEGFPGHAECYSCHIHQAGQKLGDCESCHAAAPKSVAFNRGNGSAARDYNFLHSTHRTGKDNAVIACRECHALSSRAPGVSDIARMTAARGEKHNSTCWGTCHQPQNETACGKCHVSGVPLPLRIG